MTLIYSDLANIFPKRKGTNDLNLTFNTVTAFAQVAQPKGIFIPLYNDSGELSKAIESGAIAAIWKEDKALPAYTPNDFPVFLINDLWKGLEAMLAQYRIKLASREMETSEQTKFYFSLKNSLNEIENTYDIAVIVKEFNQLNDQRNKEGRE